MRRVGPGSFAVAVVVLVSGCVGSGDAATPAGGADSVPRVAEPGTARIDVLVTDDAFAPLEGVAVVVSETQQSVATAADGRVAIVGLAPGSYTLFAQRLGFESGAKRVDLEADAVASVHFQLQPLALVDAYHLTLVLRGYMACGGGLVIVAFTFCGTYTQPTPVGNVTLPPLDPNHRVFFDQDGTPQHKSIVAELVWTPGAALAATAMQLQLWQNHRCYPVCDPEYDYGGAEGRSPVVLLSDGPFKGLKEGPATITHTVWTPFSTPDPPYVVLTVQQTFMLYSTHFFGLDAPEDFAARPDQ